MSANAVEGHQDVGLVIGGGAGRRWIRNHSGTRGAAFHTVVPDADQIDFVGVLKTEGFEVCRVHQQTLRALWMPR